MTVKEMIKTEIEKLPENLLAEVLGGKQGQIPFNISLFPLNGMLADYCMVLQCNLNQLDNC